MTADRLRWTSIADAASTAAVRLWFVVTLIGQLIFAATVATYYATTAARGNLRSWNRSMTHGYIPGEPFGNAVVAVHLLSAVVIILSGAMQLVPQIRKRAPGFHRWNGRVYVATAFTVSLAGLYMLWARGTVGGLVPHLGQSLDAMLIMLCAVMALRYALARDFATHRRWTLRLYLVVSASLFIRASLILGALASDQDAFLAFMSFAQYLVPLAVLELYLRAERGGAPGRLVMAAVILLLTVGLGAGLSAATLQRWLPTLQRAYDGRQSIADVLAATITAGGIDEAAAQYRELKAAGSLAYNFGVNELNTLGYELIRDRKVKDAIRVFQLNVEAYPQSSNAFDSLGEAYMLDGDKSQAILNYRRSVELDPRNGNAVKFLHKLGSGGR